MTIIIDWQRAMEGWTTLYGFTRNSMLILAFFCLLGALIPKYVPGTALENDRIVTQQDDIQKRLDQQDVRNQRVDDRLQSITNELADSRKWQDSMSDRLNICLIGFLVFVAKQMFERAFGGRFGERNAERNGGGNGTKT